MYFSKKRYTLCSCSMGSGTKLESFENFVLHYILTVSYRKLEEHCSLNNFVGEQLLSLPPSPRFRRLWFFSDVDLAESCSWQASLCHFNRSKATLM